MEVVDKARQMLEEAVRIRASDIFFLPKKGGYKLRLRAGDLEERPSLTREAGNELINWFKYQAEMDIAEHRRPQVGSMAVNLAGQDYWLRLSSVGDYRGGGLIGHPDHLCFGGEPVLFPGPVQGPGGPLLAAGDDRDQRADGVG